ncbi:trehalose 6-phosphate synthase [Kushneria sinocarnis]|uniref:Trehalose 6-phosphate synthase n=1 Tax=Kushneria sinocarnis TaxID=595502 RepID=A0A420WY97_9GAMM|nr:trehalose-6-phosphate synthase [Kushneria sinocarnis]RKR06163.1 trehalose 6-phosphate synthase [Kushneria sinocarnis]
MNSLIVASNRVPSPDKGSGSQGGLAVGVMNALSRTDGLWLGWNGNTEEAPSRVIDHYDFDGVRFATFPMSIEEHRLFYIGYSNEVLWPLFHYRPDMIEYNREKERGYLAVNQLFADNIRTVVNEDSRIWIHDYQLMAVGHLLRQSGVEAPLGFFLHTPFPPWDLLRILPEYENLLHYMSAYDTIGFQTDLDLYNFRDCMKRGIGAEVEEDGTLVVDGRRSRADVYPISIDIETAREMAEQGEHSPTGQRLKRSLNNRPLMIGTDRLDYSKGLYKRFQAYERLLERFEERRGNVIYIQISPSSRTDVEEYAALRTTLERVTGHVNGRFAEYDWMPLRYLNRGYDRASIMGFLRQSRVALITPLRDGMNLVAKEFIAAQDPEDPGVLVLSHLAGASRELADGALLCNPFDIDGVAEVMERALSMPLEERRARWQSMMTVLRNNDIHQWSESFLAALDHNAGRRRDGQQQ